VTLTAKQTAFCREYLIDFNATQAAIRAGYSPRTANEQGARLLAKASLQVEIRRLVDERAKRVEVSADFVVRTLVENVQRSMQAVPVLDVDGNPVGEYRYNGAVVNKALELLGRHLGMFTDRQEIEHSVRQPDNLLANLLQEVEARRRGQIIDDDFIERRVLETSALLEQG
jgi:phage terminase small subunit